MTFLKKYILKKYIFQIYIKYSGEALQQWIATMKLTEKR